MIDSQLKNKLDILIPKNVKEIVSKINSSGGNALLVGGAVRDLFLGKETKDIDIEVHNLSLDELEKILTRFGVVRKVGKSFGVLRIDGVDVDWSIPRVDSSGRKPEVSLDPHMGYNKAFARRDLTINSMGIDLATYALIDPFDGKKDLKSGTLRAIDEDFFKEDPLRFFRVMQFIGRFGFEPDEKLNQICAKIDISNISKERIAEEFEKLFLKAAKPSLGITWLDKVGRLKEILPELYETKFTEQNPHWHPEGEVFEHLMQAVDFAAKQEYSSDEERLLQVVAAMCHDLGKVVSSKIVDGQIKSHGHESTGVPLAKKMLQRITNKKDLINKVCVLTRYHMDPGNYARNNARDAAYKRLAWKLQQEADLTMEQLYRLLCSDRAGRNKDRGKPLHAPDDGSREFFKKITDLGILYGPEEPVLKGEDFIKIGINPGPQIGDMLDKAYKIQLEEGILNKDILIKKVLG